MPSENLRVSELFLSDICYALYMCKQYCVIKTTQNELIDPQGPQYKFCKFASIFSFHFKGFLEKF